MLGKLIYYETKAFGRIMLPLYAAALAFSLFMGLGLRIIPADLLEGLPYILMFMIYTFLILAVMIMTGVLSVTRFYNNLLGREGYLMFSLPTGTLSLIGSKVISVLIWSALSGLAALLTVILCGIGAGGMYFLREIPSLFRFLAEWKDLPSALALTGTTLVFLAVTAAASIVRIYAAIAIGHQFNGHRIAWSVVAYIAFQIIETIIGSLFGLFAHSMSPFETWAESFGRFFEAETVSAMLLVEWWAIVGAAVFIVIFGLLTWFLLDRRLNLE